MAEKEVLCNIKPVEAPLSLLAAFYSFNINLPKASMGFLNMLYKNLTNSSCLSNSLKPQLIITRVRI